MSTGREVSGLSKRIRRLEKPEDGQPEGAVTELWLPANGRDVVTRRDRQPGRSRTRWYDPARWQAAIDGGASEREAFEAAELSPEDVERLTAAWGAET